MEHLQEELDAMLAQLPNEHEVRELLASLVSVYPFNEYEYIISTLLALDILDLKAYQKLRNDYIERNPNIHLFEKGPTAFGKTWAEAHIREFVPDAQQPSQTLDPRFSNEYDLFLDGVRIEVKASRAVDKDSAAPLSTGREITDALSAPSPCPLPRGARGHRTVISRTVLNLKALASDSTKRFLMNFQQLKPRSCDVFVWVAVWRDVIRYWVLSSSEVETNPYYSLGQHRGNVGEGQLHVKQDNIDDLDRYEVKSSKLEEAIRQAYQRELEANEDSG